MFNNLTNFGHFAQIFFSENCLRVQRLAMGGKPLTNRYLKEQRRLLNKHILVDSELCSTLVSNLNMIILQAYLVRLIEKHGYCRSSQAIVGLLKLILSEAYLYDLTTKDFSKYLPRINYQERGRGILTLIEMKNFLQPQFYSSAELHCFFVTSLLGGFRLNEILALHWESIDFDKNLIYIKDAWKDELTLGLPKSGKTRIIPLSPISKEFLLKLRFSQNRDSGLVFKSPTSKSGKRTDGYVLKNFKKVLTKMNIDYTDRNIVFHSLRHSLKSYLTAQGMPFEVQRLFFGWSKTSAEAMAERYTHFDPSMSCYLESCSLFHKE